MNDPTGHETPLSVDAVISQFGARMEVGLQLRMQTTPLELAKNRAMVRQKVRTCTACHLRQKCAGPVATTGPVEGGQAKVMVVGEAPGKQEDAKGQPFVGPAGKLLRAMMSGVGFDVDEVAWCNVVSCWPDRTPATPNMVEMQACRTNLKDQVVSSGSTYVLLVGGIATSAWRGDLKVSDVHGMVGIWGGMWVVMPVFHPAAILRDVTKKRPTMDDLARWYEIVASGRGLDWLSTTCVKCGGHVDHYDPDGVAWCREHWARYGGQWKVEREKWEPKMERVKVKRGVGKRDTVLIDGQQTF